MSSPNRSKFEKRFAFGKNWARFIEILDEDRLAEAERSLQEMLGSPRLDGLTFLDAGCGSGLFSLAARRLGARVHSFDFDPISVATTRSLKERFAPSDSDWLIAHGSVLDTAYLSGLGQFDVVYSWGVLHHTGQMWQAMDIIAASVANQGRLFISLYNDQGLISDFWRKVKRLYCSGVLGRIVVIPVFFTFFVLAGLTGDLLRRRNPLRRYTEYRRNRGMSLVHDWIDWVGGYPYEAANPGEVFEFYTRRGFAMSKLTTRPSRGCNEYVFRHTGVAPFFPPDPIT
ncbi:class I SAM-dependent methyltransferase [uncultured Lamprocystis sp.]|jgi:2-polyprenyl-6-hydroxyphenyl methylase/3-demethylubiquinone-9 3-methyltransferase|uniref:class I SAM-dependent methyltransferase n=1 Tax=uncultured Lamprocystis sp. TaxID=543132 RepID=UPI0025F8ADE6|nr:class I SAM-dependent methyltransferase [uncultured Lamprocystis sp.]